MLTEEEQKTLEAYDKIAVPWIQTRRNSNFWEKEFLEFKNFLSAGKIIELGCSGGRDSVWLEKNGYDYTGVDFSPKMIEQARTAYPNTKFQVGSFDQLDFPKNYFDGFWASASLMHVPKSKISRILKNISSVIRPGAIGFIAVKEGEGEHWFPWGEIPASPKGFFALYRSKEFQAQLEENGYQVLQSGNHLSGLDNGRMFITYFVKKI